MLSHPTDEGIVVVVIEVLLKGKLLRYFDSRFVLALFTGFSKGIYANKQRLSSARILLGDLAEDVA